jgi:hypothetical protein
MTFPIRLDLLSDMPVRHAQVTVLRTGYGRSPSRATSNQLSNGTQPMHCGSLKQQKKPLRSGCELHVLRCLLRLPLVAASFGTRTVQPVAWSLYGLSYPDTYSTHSKALLQTMTATQHTPSLSSRPEGPFLFSHYLANGTCPEPDESNP